jgi:hypothetical protein
MSADDAAESLRNGGSRRGLEADHSRNVESGSRITGGNGLTLLRQVSRYLSGSGPLPRK